MIERKAVLLALGAVLIAGPVFGDYDCKVGADIAPNASAPFTFQTPRLPQRSDGRFVTRMDVISFSEVGP